MRFKLMISVVLGLLLFVLPATLRAQGSILERLGSLGGLDNVGAVWDIVSAGQEPLTQNDLDFVLRVAPDQIKAAYQHGDIYQTARNLMTAEGVTEVRLIYIGVKTLTAYVGASGRAGQLALLALPEKMRPTTDETALVKARKPSFDSLLQDIKPLVKEEEVPSFLMPVYSLLFR